MKRNIKTYKLILISLFSAFCCVGTMIQIPLPTGDMIHLGNFVCILAALLCGGFIGGLSGSIGMGIYDLVFYTAYPSTIVRTFIMKFLMGFTAGYLFRLFLSKKIRKEVFLYLFTLFFIIVTVVFSVIVFKNDGIISVTIGGVSATTSKMTYLIPIASLIFSLALLFSCFYYKRLREVDGCVLIAVSFAVVVNIIGSFVLRIPLEMIIDKVDFQTSLIKSITSIPSLFSTGIVSVIFAVIAYYPLHNATKNVNLLEQM